jgi:hypothetical protein
MHPRALPRDPGERQGSMTVAKAASWRIVLIRNKGEYIGAVEAPIRTAACRRNLRRILFAARATQRSTAARSTKKGAGAEAPAGYWLEETNSRARISCA